ncbi:hypothetical protein P3T27_006980 [Kitasatospora sp. MAA19]|uniref:hypothetical protein n=1 Tax=Kitasatospora sp. MAA19 TaxID=3035090 RepID=UPI0024730C5C|nr:hypothetical protein [Kitasatospora sp. MAA19]MDH6710231.1 hypothetical protein [Kitasatospora sp. MAA19]
MTGSAVAGDRTVIDGMLAEPCGGPGHRGLRCRGIGLLAAVGPTPAPALSAR